MCWIRDGLRVTAGGHNCIHMSHQKLQYVKFRLLIRAAYSQQRGITIFSV